MPIYRRACKFSCLHLLLLLQFHFQIQHSCSALRIVRNSGKQAHQAVSHNYQRVILGATYQKNVKLTIRISSSLLVISSATWRYIFLYCCGDVHPNPGPNSTTSSESFTSSSSTTTNITLDTLNQNHHLVFIHYNVQSLLPKLVILQAELYAFDFIASTESWLHLAIDTDELILPSFSPPERKDRQTDRHGGVILYVKEYIHYLRRHDLEPRVSSVYGSKSSTNTSTYCLGVFYRPPNALRILFSNRNLNLAVDTGYSDIIVTGDLTSTC